MCVSSLLLTYYSMFLVQPPHHISTILLHLPTLPPPHQKSLATSLINLNLTSYVCSSISSLENPIEEESEDKVLPPKFKFKVSGVLQSSMIPLFTLKKRGALPGVYDYFDNQRKIALHYSADLPCINVRKPKRPTYVLIEICSLVSLKHYTKALSRL
ncbi:protein argonaute 4A [Medicago truncatula]|uniref:protein argonaute 4A n=1 Tax=Medicago truncatula TaxID=3880 RepID=UPI001966F7A0|nr:protein argonaute 4A [Medicago truncatula]